MLFTKKYVIILGYENVFAKTDGKNVKYGGFLIMLVAQYILGIVLILLAVGLTALILMQSGKDKSLSSTIAGGSTETFFGKSGGSTNEKRLTRWTIIGAAVFVVLAIVLAIIIAASAA